MQEEASLQLAKSVKDLKQRMAPNSSFEKRHYNKVDIAYQHFLERFKESDVSLPASAEEVF